MSVLFGIWNSVGQYDLKNEVTSMMQLPVKFTPDQSEIWYKDQIALGQNTIFSTPESFLEKLPHYNVNNNLTIAGTIRLTNRPELFAQLGIAAKEQPGMGDASLVIASYIKWGERCAGHLLGSFAFAIWDGNQDKLFICTDHFNSRGLFYFHKGNTFIFASSAEAILLTTALKTVVNYNKLSVLAYPNAKHLFWGETWYEDIFSIPAATSFTIDENGLRKHKYWTPEIKEPLSFKSEKDFSEAFKDVMFRVIGDSLHSSFPVTSHLSGGLDSSAIVAVAAKILEKQNKELQVMSVVLPDPNDPLLEDERYYIDLFKQVPNVKINYITTPGGGFISDVEELLKYSSEPGIISRHYLNVAFIEKARELGSRTILSGAGGEFGITNYADGIYAEYFLSMRWGRLWNEIKARKTLTGELLWDNVRSKVIKPLMPKIIKKNLTGQHYTLRSEEVDFFQPEFSTLLKKRLHLVEDVETKLSGGTAPNHRVNQLKVLKQYQNKARGGYHSHEIDNRAPLFDLRLLDFCLATPAQFKLKNGFNRYMVRAGLDGILPPEIQWRLTKTAFSPDYHRRYNQQKEQARAYLNAISQNDPVRKIINIEHIKTWLDVPVADNERGTFAERLSRDHVPQAIFLIQYLKRFKEFKM